jgi:aspartate-semialdehyde dehydrogenase
VNREDLKLHQGIIANPNCSTIQMVCVLAPLQKAFGLKKVIVSTYQAVSGAGTVAIEELKNETTQFEERTQIDASVLPVKSGEKHYPIAFNVIPQIDVFGENGYTYEEMKMINETRKIMHMNELPVTATCVRLPVVAGHSEAVFIETETEQLSISEVRRVLDQADGVTLLDDPSTQTYPMPLFAEGKEDVFVGRIRSDLDSPSNLHLWIVSDNLLKGAALNSIQIAEAMIEDGIK